MKITIVKLVTGDVVMGKLDTENTTDEKMRLLKPMTLMLDPMQGGVGMMPYDAVFSQKEPEFMDFDTIHIVHEIPVHETFEEAYIKQTTGIETPKQELIV